MTDLNKLRRELKFIEDSLKSQILTKEEYLVAKSRIEAKIRALEALEPKPEPAPRSRFFRSEPKVEPYYEEQERAAPLPKPEKKPELPPERAKTPLYSYTRAAPRKFPWRVIIAMFLLIIALTIYALLPKDIAPKEPFCSSDLECQRAGYEGKCVSPATTSANCTFAPAKPVAITVLTSDCPVCETQRMENTLRQIYPGAAFERIDS
ncbi:MAG: hypothetical protein Q7S65_04800, partial [Nanoarchaeota archaeon]|nr:hypothetical protein [Nanoarchaeota archaeon]